MESEEAIKECRTLIATLPNFHLGGSEAIITVLQALEKYKTEYEAFRNGEKFTAKQMKFIEKEYIPKKKIENKIKELQENGYFEFLETRDLEKTIKVLQELLGDKNV